MTSCDHEYTQICQDDITGDDVTVCCHCEETLAPAVPKVLPKHWFKHKPKDTDGEVLLASDVINGTVPQNRHDERLIHICGGCGHWMGAVHSKYFARTEAEPPYDVSENRPAFVDGLMESLCPKCGSANFRQTSVVTPLSNAKEMPQSFFKEYIRDRTDQTFWRSEFGNHLIPASMIENAIWYVDDDYYCRCPACGYAASYGDREFDFHHWDYNEDVGCQLCRDCHSYIHRDMRASQQRREIGDDWQRDAVGRLLDVCERSGLEFNDYTGFRHRFNIPAGTKASEAALKELPPNENVVPITELVGDE